MEIVKERVTVDVSGVDWSELTAWASDFAVSEMECDRGCVPKWAGHVIEHRVTVLVASEKATGVAVSHDMALGKAKRAAERAVNGGGSR